MGLVGDINPCAVHRDYEYEDGSSFRILGDDITASSLRTGISLYTLLVYLAYKREKYDNDIFTLHLLEEFPHPNR